MSHRLNTELMLSYAFSEKEIIAINPDQQYSSSVTIKARTVLGDVSGLKLK